MSTVLGIDITSLIQPLMLRAVITGQEVNMDAIMDLLISEKIQESILTAIEVPSEWADLVNLMLETDKVRRFMAILRGETPPEPAIDRVIELVVNLKLIESLTASVTA